MAMVEFSNYVKSVKNLILPLLNGEEHICRCLCAREQAYHVVSYQDASIEVYTDDVIPVVAGLAVGVFIFWSLFWLVVILRLFIDGRSLLWKPKFRNAKDSLILRCIQNMEDVSEDVSEDVAGTDSDVHDDDQSNNIE